MNTVKKQIQNMLHTDGPYFPPPEEIYQTTTDINQWPYPRMFRGKPESFEPVIWEREAGYQKNYTTFTQCNMAATLFTEYTKSLLSITLFYRPSLFK